MKSRNKDLSCPPGLTAEGYHAWEVILKFLRQNRMLYTGGCKAFYEPYDWVSRGNEYGRDSVLVICHDGGSLAYLCNYDHCDYQSIEKFKTHLARYGFWVENCTTWYSAIYTHRAMPLNYEI